MNNYENNSMYTSNYIFIIRRVCKENTRNAEEENEATDIVNPHYIYYSNIFFIYKLDIDVIKVIKVINVKPHAVSRNVIS